MTSSTSSQSSLLGAIFPDELLWSYHGRLHARYPSFDFEAVLGAAPSYRKAFPTQLARLAGAFTYVGAPCVTELIEGHTFYKFALPEISRRAAAYLAHSMAEQTFPSLAPQHLIHEGSFQLRLCPHCVRDDVPTFGVAYWHRLHQLPELRICPVHDTALHLTNVTAGQRKFVPAALAALEMREITVGSFAAQGVVARACQLIAGRSGGVAVEQARSALKSALSERGLFSKNEVRPLLVDKAVAKFGCDAVHEFGLDETPTRLSSWQSVSKLALICATMGMPLEQLLDNAALVKAEDWRDEPSPGECHLLSKVAHFAPIVAAKLKREALRVSPWALANALKETLGPGFAANYSWKPTIRLVLKVHAETRQQFQKRLAQAA